jgi:GntR family transcriptional regulator / MocR family aminotransferase
MPRRSRASFLSLQAGPATAGLSLRALIHRSCLEAIVDGRVAPGDRLPSARQLASDWRISRNTVDDALSALQAEGLLERRVGAGTFVTSSVARSRRAVRELRPPSAFGRDALTQLSRWSRDAAFVHAPGASPKPQAFIAGLPDVELFPHDLWRRLTARRMRTSARSLAGYLPPLGLPALQDATARHLAAARGLVCEPGQILVLNSTMQAADLIARVLLERGQPVWIEDPSFPNLRSALAASGARLVPVPVDHEGIDVAAGIARAPAAALAYVTPSCHYPLGVALSMQRRLALLDWAARTGAWIVEDDYQSEFIYEGRAHAPLASLERNGRVLHVGTFTNAVFPSLRLAYVVLPPQLVDVFAAVRGQLDDHTHGLAQAVLADFLDAGHFAAHLRRMRAVYEARREALVRTCTRELPPGAALRPASGGMNAVLLLSGRRSESAITDAASQPGVRALPLSRYALRSRAWRGLLLGYAALDEASIRDGVSRLGRAIRASLG